MGVMVISLGFAVLFNFIILRIKWSRGNYADVGVDILMLALLNSVFGGSILGVISATAGSTLISLYLIWYPIKLFGDDCTENEETDSDCPKTKEQKAYKSMADRFDSLFD
jgi:hypothetical protein